jgi:hypothetical protein
MAEKPTMWTFEVTATESNIKMREISFGRAALFFSSFCRPRPLLPACLPSFA